MCLNPTEQRNAALCIKMSVVILLFFNNKQISYFIYCATTVQELHYADISFQNNDGGTVQLGLENNSTQYSKIQMNSLNAPSSPPTYDAHMQRIRGKAPQPGANGAHSAHVHKN